MKKFNIFVSKTKSIYQILHLSSLTIPIICLFSFCCRICDEYNFIAKRMSEVPQNTEQLVEYEAFLKKSSEVTVVKLNKELIKAAHRLQILMDYADLSRMSNYRI